MTLSMISAGTLVLASSIMRTASEHPPPAALMLMFRTCPAISGNAVPYLCICLDFIFQVLQLVIDVCSAFSPFALCRMSRAVCCRTEQHLRQALSISWLHRRHPVRCCGSQVR